MRVLLLFLAFLFLFTGCAETQSRTEVSSSIPVSETGLDTVTKHIVSEFDPDRKAYWPNENWTMCFPEQVGVDSELLYNMVKRVIEEDIDIESIFVVRKGYSILDVSFSADKSMHGLYSCTKSFTSALIGIAIKEGHIPGVEMRVLDYFSDKNIENVDERKKEMTIEHLLSMSAGLEWHGYDTPDYDNYTVEMFYDEDPVKYVLDKPMVIEPGESFVYNTGASQVLASIIENASGLDVKTFADNTLFKELGITEYNWQTTVSGDYSAGGGLHMNSMDMAKLGYLYLNNGVWDRKQILPENWVEASTSKHSNVTDFRSDGYGYQWWINDFGGYSARGMYGQYIFVMPEEDMVVVFQSSLEGADGQYPVYFMEDYLLPAIKSENSLPENNEYNDLLESICKGLIS